MMRYTILLFCVLAIASGLHVSMNHQEPFYPGYIAIKSDTGKYLTRCIGAGCGPANWTMETISLENSLSPDGVWKVDPIGLSVTFQGTNKKYLTSCYLCFQRSKQQDPAASISKYSSDGLFSYEDRGNGRWWFKHKSTGKYLNRCGDCVSGVTKELAFVDGDPYGTVGMNSAFFTFEYVFPLGRIRLNDDQGHFLTRCRGCGPTNFNLPDSASLHETKWDSPSIAWLAERWGDKIALRCPDTLNYLARCTNCWNGSNIPDSAFVHVWSTRDPAALWTPIWLGNGRWALKSDLGRHLSRCTNCVPGAAYPNLAFAHVDSPSEGRWAHWFVMGMD